MEPSAVQKTPKDSLTKKEVLPKGPTSPVDTDVKSSPSTATNPDVRKHPVDSLLARSPWIPLVLLNGVAIVWGSQHAVIKDAVEALSPGLVNAGRFSIAALLFSPFLRADPALWAAGLELGSYMFAGYALQAVGLQFTTASRSAFLLYLNVKFVPIIAGLVGRKIELSTWVSAAIAVAGTILLSYDGKPPNVGDVWSVAAALVSALFILRLEMYAGEFPAAALNATSLAVVAAASLVWTVAVDGLPSMDTSTSLMSGLSDLTSGPAWQSLVYLGVVTTALSNYVQTVGQRYVPADKAAIIFAMDPVYGAMFSYLLLDEKLGPQGFVGAGLIMVAALFTQARSLLRLNRDTDPSAPASPK